MVWTDHHINPKTCRCRYGTRIGATFEIFFNSFVYYRCIFSVWASYYACWWSVRRTRSPWRPLLRRIQPRRMILPHIRHLLLKNINRRPSTNRLEFPLMRIVEAHSLTLDNFSNRHSIRALTIRTVVYRRPDLICSIVCPSSPLLRIRIRPNRRCLICPATRRSHLTVYPDMEISRLSNRTIRYHSHRKNMLVIRTGRIAISIRLRPRWEVRNRYYSTRIKRIIITIRLCREKG